MKLEKKHYVIIAVILVIILIWYFSKNKDESSWWIFSKKQPIVPIVDTKNTSGCMNCWVSSTEEGVDYCRWFDNYGRNTRTFTGSCSTSQSNMGQASTRKKPWWAALFGI